MDYLEIEGGHKLKGSIKISGAKNAALPIIAMSIIASKNTEIQNVPNVADINTLCQLLRNLGADTKFENSKLIINTDNINSTKATYDIVRKMRASILVLGPLLARFKECSVSLPGGCAIGARPIDLHIQALEKMGAVIEIKEGYLVASAKNGLKGADIIFDKITVTGTENILMAAALAKGKTTIINAAKEPEIVQLCEILKEAGLDIKGIGTSQIEITGTDGKLIKLPSIKVIPDRIEAGTYLCIGALLDNELSIENANSNHLIAVIDKLEEIGCRFDVENDKITIHPPKVLKSVDIITSEFPGLPTDMQAQFMALACISNGTSIIDERLFENRFMHASELARMGADIKINGHVATVIGGELIGADVMATDLRASSALIIAALKAKGISKIHRIYHLDRGYERIEEKLSKVGAKIRRLKENVC